MSFVHVDADGRSSLSGLSVAVFGLGKMGLPLASVFADNGATVHGVDIDESVVNAVNDGVSPVTGEPRLPELVDEYGGEELTATTDGVAAAERADVHIALVPTIVGDDNEPILDPLLAVADDIRQGVSAGDLVVLESTVPPGTTTGKFAAAIEPDGLEAGVDFGVAHCPERTASGQAIQDITSSYPKIVGGLSKEGTEAAASIYREINSPGVIEMSSATAAEAVKVFEGVYRDVNIALANELGMACEEWGLSASEVFEAANSQPFCNLHTPGCGVGGHCIPVYPHFVIDGAASTPLLETSRAVNDGMPEHTVTIWESLARGQGVSLDDASVLVLGLTYRAGVEELRFAPAVDIVALLADRGVDVSAHDPLLDDETIESLGASPVADPTAVDGLDGVILATAHSEYADLDLGQFARSLRTPILVDGRNLFDVDDTNGLLYAAIGEGTEDHPRRTPQE